MEQWINRSNDGCTFHRKDSCVGIRGACYFLHAQRERRSQVPSAKIVTEEDDMKPRPKNGGSFIPSIESHKTNQRNMPTPKPRRSIDPTTDQFKTRLSERIEQQTYQNYVPVHPPNTHHCPHPITKDDIDLSC